ncbi:MAG: mammalian cell entry protein [Actinomycetota bacterium]|nr:mammalian cell entry protein [Actinomycetota bacterium]
MSPRRLVASTDRDFFNPKPRRPRRWGLPLATAVSVLVFAAALAVSIFTVVGHESYHHTQVRDATALDYVRGFMTTYTTLDPFNANAYVERVQAQGTGEFAKEFKEKSNEIAIQVARAEPTQGSVLEAGVQRWKDNGSADVLVATKISTTAADGKTTIESGSRWIVTTVEEGQQWKISQLIQVI